MKRVRWLVLLIVLGLGSFAPAFTPSALAVSSGQDCPGNAQGKGIGGSDCAMLIVHLIGTNVPSTGITVQVNRKKKYLGIDESFTLDNRPALAAKGDTSGYLDWDSKHKFTDDTTYTSLFEINGTSSSQPCYTDPASSDAIAEGTFLITVSGGGLTSTATASSGNICNQGEKNININVSTKAAPATTGGFHSTPTYKDDLTGATGTCKTSSFMDIYGGPDNIKQGSSSDPKYQVTPNGSGVFTSATTFKPGTYNVDLLCYNQVPASAGNSYEYKGTVVITAGGDTAVDMTNIGRLGGGGNNGPTPTPTPVATVVPPVCDVGSLSWLACPAIDAIDGAVTGIEKAIQNQLEFAPLTTGPGLYNVWQSFRNLADVFFVLIFMLVIFGTALGFDSYTVKKVLPRLVAAAVLIQFSWTLVGLAVDISNVAGAGVASLITLAPGTKVPDASSTEKVIGSLELGAAGVTAIAVAGSTVALTSALLIPLLLTIVSLLIGVVVVFLTLELRILLIEVAIVISPLAILAWVLPNTEKLFKRWRDFLMDLLMMYPIIMLLFLGGALVSIVGANATGTDVFARIEAALGPLIAFLLVPTTFKIAEGALTKGGDFISKAGAGKAQKGIAGAKAGIKTRQEADKKQKAVTNLGKTVDKLNSGQALTRREGFAARRNMGKAGFGAETSLSSLAQNSPQRYAAILGATAKAEQTEQAGFARQFDAEADSSKILARIATAKTTAERKAGIAALAKRGDTKSLGEASKLDAFKGKNGEFDAGNAEWQQAIAGSFGDLKTRAPHLAKPNSYNDDGSLRESPYDTLDSASLAGLDARGHEALLKRVGESPAAAANAAKIIGELDRKAALTGSSGARGGTDPHFASLRTEVVARGGVIPPAPSVGAMPTAPSTATAGTVVLPATPPVAPPAGAPSANPGWAGAAGGLPPAPAGGTPARQAPRISERLVDPRVEGDTEGQNDNLI